MTGAATGADAGCNGGIVFGKLNSGCCCNSRMVCPELGIGAAMTDISSSNIKTIAAMRIILYCIIGNFLKWIISRQVRQLTQFTVLSLHRRHTS